MREYVAIDLETTGLSPQKERIIEIAAVRFRDGQEVDHFSTLVNPGRPLSERIVALTGIRDDMLADAPGEEEALSAFLAYVGEGILLGHNLTFDYSFIKTACARRRLTYERKGIDTLALARKHLPELPSRTLPALCRYFHIDAGTSHRALDDARSAALLYECLCREFGEGNESPLAYQVKKIAPMTPAQKNYLNDLLKYHKIECNVSYETMSRSEASRMIDKILLEYGRPAGRRTTERGKTK